MGEHGTEETGADDEIIILLCHQKNLLLNGRVQCFGVPLPAFRLLQLELEVPGILGQQATLDVWATINDKNTYKVTTFNVYFVAPLKINSELKGANFVDQVISGSTIDCSKAFTMTDFKDYIVAKVTTGTTEKEKYAEELYEYYVVKDPVWNLADAKTNLKKDSEGNYVVDETITAETATVKAEDRFGVGCITEDTAAGTLTFKNVKGVKVEKTVKLFIPVTVSHKWGTLTETVTVSLLPEATE